MAQQIFSNCSPLVTGCTVYSDISLVTPVSNGKYSNGSECFTVVGGTITLVENCPTPTPTPTPTLTPTPTPTPTLTPTPTPTLTPTPTPTPTPSGTITIENSTSTSSTMSDVTPGSFYFIGTGSFPLNNGQGLTATHSGYSGVLSINISSAASGSSKINVWVNSTLVECVNVTVSGIYNTASLTIGSTAIVLIEYVDGSC